MTHRGLMKADKNKRTGLQAPMGETTVLLHTCCAPCSSAIIEAMVQNGITPVIYYCNPNIYPREEYEIRKNECTRYAQSLGLDGTEIFDISGLNLLNDGNVPETLKVKATKDDGTSVEFNAVVRIDTPGEAEYYRNGGILQYVLRNLMKRNR